jgi:diguanylate cyclase (GGDEF)-like protein
MKYRWFEGIVLIVGGAAILGSILLSVGTPLIAEEIVAQLLLLGVLVGAVHWGRNGGFIAATVASLIYVVLRIPLVVQAEGLTADVATLILIRVVTFGLVGVVGGELCSRIKYVFARLEDSSSIDDWSQVYNQRFITRALESAHGQYARYETPYSVVLIHLDSRLLEELRPSKQRTLIRGVANCIRNDIRLVDEAGRLEDGRFVVILPHTPGEGADVVAERLAKGVSDTLGSKEESVTAQVMAAPQDIAQLDDLRAGLERENDSSTQSAPSST